MIILVVFLKHNKQMFLTFNLFLRFVRVVIYFLLFDLFDLFFRLSFIKYSGLTI